VALKSVNEKVSGDALYENFPSENIPWALAKKWAKTIK
jgi:hypothetical protein